MQKNAKVVVVSLRGMHYPCSGLGVLIIDPSRTLNGYNNTISNSRES